MKKITIAVLIFFVLLMIGFCSVAGEKEQKETIEQVTEIETDERQAEPSVEISTQPLYESVTQKEILVWIPNSGIKYHSSSTCSKMKNPSQVSLEKAVRLGYSACKKCY